MEALKHRHGGFDEAEAKFLIKQACPSGTHQPFDMLFAGEVEPQLSLGAKSDRQAAEGLACLHRRRVAMQASGLESLALVASLANHPLGHKW